MNEQPADDEVFEEAFPDPEELRPYIGRVVAFDTKTGEIRDSAGTFEELAARFTEEALESLSLLLVPGYRFIA